jgi:hypothetical protein
VVDKLVGSDHPDFEFVEALCGWCRTSLAAQQRRGGRGEFCSMACEREAAESDGRDWSPIFGGKWEMSYGELFSGGDMALFTITDDGSPQRIATFQEHGDDSLTAEENTLSVNTAELFLRAPAMLALIQRLAAQPHGDDLYRLQDDAAVLLAELEKEWQR